MARRILIKNIKTLFQIDSSGDLRLRKGKAMKEMETLSNAWLAIEDGTILAWGKMEEWAGITDWRDLQVIDAQDQLVLPGFCDPHTHLVWAGDRSDEFVDKINGLTYEEIAKRGGGILNSAATLQQTSEDDLYEQAVYRLKEIMSNGTTAVEIKSGYGLSVEAELKILRVIKRLKEDFPLTIKATFLGAHAIPLKYKSFPEKYLDLLENEMLPQIAEERLADYIDVFCEKGYFSLEDTKRVLEAGKRYGLKPKIHVNQFNAFGGVPLGVAYDAVSVDHLEVMQPEDFKALLNSNTMPTVLPSCSFFLRIPYAPAREMIDKGLPVALGSDYNPGSTPSGNIPFLLSLACIQQRLTPIEALNAATINAAAALELSETHGKIAEGAPANLIITKKVSGLAAIPYAFGSNHIDTVLVNGQIVND